MMIYFYNDLITILIVSLNAEFAEKEFWYHWFILNRLKNIVIPLWLGRKSYVNVNIVVWFEDLV